MQVARPLILLSSSLLLLPWEKKKKKEKNLPLADGPLSCLRRDWWTLLPVGSSLSLSSDSSLFLKVDDALIKSFRLYGAEKGNPAWPEPGKNKKLGFI